MASEGLLFPTVLQAAGLGLLSVRTMHSTARRQEDLGRDDVKPPREIIVASAGCTD